MSFNKKRNTIYGISLPDVYVLAVLFFVAILIIFTSHRHALLLPKGLTAYLACLGCLWIGKFSAQHWVKKNNYIKIIALAILAGLTLSVAVAIFWVKVLSDQAYFPIEILTIFIPLALSVIILSFFISIVRNLGFKNGVDLPKNSSNTIIENFFFIKAEGKNHKIEHDQILYAEANGNYTKIVTERTVIKPNMTFSKLETLLPPSNFIRTHRSFIVNKSKITHIEGNRAFLSKHEIPIGSNFKKAFFNTIKLYNIEQ